MNKTPKLYFALLTLGFSTSIIQVIMIREFISVFYSNEIIFGIIIAFWMTLTGLGAWLGGKKQQKELPERDLFGRFAILGFMPLVVVFLLNYLKHILFQPGVLIGIWQLLPVIVFSLSPICLIGGNIFTLITKNSLTANHSNIGGKFYAIESTGSIIGGLMVSFVMVLWLNTMQSLAIVCAINLVVTTICFSGKKFYLKATLLLIGIILISSVFVFNVDLTIRQFIFPGQKIMQTHETPYGNLTFTESDNQLNVFENLSLLFTTENTIENEETVHYPMLQHQNPLKVLLIGGGISGKAYQILKYPTLEELIYVEPNPWLLHHALKILQLPGDKRLKVRYSDGRNFVVNNSENFDVIIVSLPEPSTLQLNRFYTKEYIRILKLHLLPAGIVSFGIYSSENYNSTENRMALSVMYNTLKTGFSNVIVIPGEKEYFLASDSFLSSQIGRLDKERRIENTYVNPGYIDDLSLEERSHNILKNILPDAPINTDLKPIATSVQTALFFSQFKINSFIIIGLVILLLLIPAYRLNSVSVYMYLTGFTASSLEMLILLVFQIIFGYLYAATGIIFAVFMFGLAIGSWIKWPSDSMASNVRLLQLLTGILAFLVPVFLTFLIKINLNLLTYPALFVLIFVPAMITGLQFSLIVHINENEQTGFTGFLYGADLLGSALGFLIVSTLILPLTGILVTGIILATINFSGIAILKFFENK